MKHPLKTSLKWGAAGLFALRFSIALAAANSDGSLPYTPLEPLPGVPQNGTANFGALLQGLFTLLLSLGALIAVAALVVGGITYMVSDVVDRKHEAKTRMYSAVWGLLLLLASFLILNTVNPQLVNFSNIISPTTGSPELSAPPPPQALTGPIVPGDFIHVTGDISNTPNQALIQDFTNKCTAGQGRISIAPVPFSSYTNYVCVSKNL